MFSYIQLYIEVFCHTRFAKIDFIAGPFGQITPCHTYTGRKRPI